MWTLWRNPLALLSASLATSQAFQNPVRDRAPDPSLVVSDGWYYLTYTSYSSITIARSQTIDGLRDGDVRTIWTDNNSTRNANMWAPELHEIDNVWYMFYSSCDSAQPCCDTCVTRVLRGCDAPGPYDCDFEHHADLVPPEGMRGGEDGNFAFSIDGTYLEVPNWGRYHVLSIDSKEKLQSLAITKLDTENWTVDKWNVISIPDQPWEMNSTGAPGLDKPVNEAPHPLWHDDDLWICYSGSFCGTPNYSLGLLHWNGGDPLESSSWEKSGPVFRQANGLYSTGHNSFFKSPDGKEIWNAYHAVTNPGGSCGPERFTNAQIVTFDENGWPDFGQPQALDTVLKPPSGECRRRRSAKN